MNIPRGRIVDAELVLEEKAFRRSELKTYTIKKTLGFISFTNTATGKGKQTCAKCVELTKRNQLGVKNRKLEV